MWTLAIETTAQVGSLALLNHAQVIDSREWGREGSHSEFITNALTEILKENNLRLSQLSRLAVSTGPGSFTGIRVGVNFARTLGYAQNLPIYSLNSLHLLAAQEGAFRASLPIRVLQYAFRNIIYTAEYGVQENKLIEVQPPTAVTTFDLDRIFVDEALVLGTAYEILFKQFSPQALKRMARDSRLRDFSLACDFARTPAVDKSPAALTDWIHAVPLYVRASEAEEKLKNGSLKPLS